MIFLALSASFVMMILDRSKAVDWSISSFIWFWPGLLGAIVLMPVNWCLEVGKFQNLLHLSPWHIRWQFIRSVLSGVTVSMFLPNRMGEFVGRLVYFPREERLKALSATLIGSLLQTSWIAGFGVVVFFYAGHWHRIGDLVQFPGLNLVIILIGLGIAGLLLTFHSRINAFLKSMEGHFRNILGSQVVTTAWAWALLRYVTYCSQFVLLLYFVGLVGPVRDAYVFVISFFFLQTILPLPPALGWIGRIQLAVVLGGALSIEPMQAIFASLMLWLLNLVLPGLLGGYFLLNQNLFKQLKDVRTAYISD